MGEYSLCQWHVVFKADSCFWERRQWRCSVTLRREDTLQNILFLNEQLPKNATFCNRTRQIEDWAHIFRLVRHWPRLPPKQTWIFIWSRRVGSLVPACWLQFSQTLEMATSVKFSVLQRFFQEGFCRWQNSGVKGLCCFPDKYKTAQTQMDLTHSLGLKWQFIIRLHCEVWVNVFVCVCVCAGWAFL